MNSSMINQQQIQSRTTASLFLSVVMIVSICFTSSAASYTVTIPSQISFPVAWSFQPKTVVNAFPMADDGTVLYFWSPATASYTTIQFDSLFGGWSNPNYVINNGVGFYYYNPLLMDKDLMVTGAAVTDPFVIWTFEAGKAYFLGMPYLQPDNSGNWVQCVLNCEGSAFPYTTASFQGYTPSFGDKFYTWNNAWVGGIYYNSVPEVCAPGFGTHYWRSVNCPDPAPLGGCWAWGTYQSAKILRGYGFWFYPAVNKTWTNWAAQVTCQQ